MLVSVLVFGYRPIAGPHRLAYNRPMDYILNIIFSMLRASPGSVWVLCLLGVVVVRNTGIRLAHSNSDIGQRAADYSSRTLLIAMCTLAICTGLVAASIVVYEQLKLN